MKRYIQSHNLVGKNKRFVSVVSGANLNFSRLRFIAERAELGEGKEAMLRVIIPEQPGAFLALHGCIHPRAVTEFVYRYSSEARAFVYMSFYLTTPAKPTIAGAASVPGTPAVSPQAARAEELGAIMGALKQKGMKALDLSDNEMAKSHARYLVGGKSKVADERVFRFEFPERPGALRKFLEGLASKFNISLFHYRNHGGGEHDHGGVALLDRSCMAADIGFGACILQTWARFCAEYKCRRRTQPSLTSG